MFKKIINGVARILTVWMAAEAIRQTWKELEKEERKEEENK